MSSTSALTSISDGLGQYALIKSYIGLFIAIVAFIICAVLGVYCIRNNTAYAPSKAIIANVLRTEQQQPVPQQQNRQATYNTVYVYTLTIQYTIAEAPTTSNNKLITSQLNVTTAVPSDTIYQTGKSIDIEYSIQQPDQARLPNWSNKTYGYIAIGIGTLILFLASINVWLLRRFPSYAKVMGGIEAVSDVSRAVREFV